MYDIETYRERMSKEREVIPTMLKLFESQGIHATWATVGLLFHSSLEELLESLPDIRPTYENEKLSPYPYIMTSEIEKEEAEDSVHYAKTLVSAIRNTKHQELSTHTYSHYYCLEHGQTGEQFAADLEAAVRCAGKLGIKLNSLVFPRNQCNEAYIPLLAKYGIKAYRGNPQHWLYESGYSTSDSIIKRIMRLADSFVNISGHHCYSYHQFRTEPSANFPASLFLRPYSRKWKSFERLRQRRLLSAMTHAARNGLICHIWWHPYNMAEEMEKNMSFLHKLVSHFNWLQSEYGMESKSMSELYAVTVERDRLLQKSV